jgi:S-adenosylmethionine:tRNA ribosyltransferase-isomerase
MARPAKRLRDDMVLEVGGGEQVLCMSRDDDGLWTVALPVEEHDAAAWLERVGEVPLPPYIHPDGQPADRYQTVFARHPGSVAAPTAGLHIDDELWDLIDQRCERATLTLHVGAGTFMPVREGDICDHHMHAERYVVPDVTDVAVRRARNDGRRVVAIGTTTTRVLETVYGPAGGDRAGATELFVTPGYAFGCVGAMLTNFHLPRSTLLALVMAFAGIETVRACYREAIERHLRFYSFGDAMFIHGRGVES